MWPFTSTTRVDATLSASRSRVANSSTVGKLEKSSGLAALSAIISTTRLIMMFAMKPMSSMIAGTGTTMNMTRSRMAKGRTAPFAALLQMRPLTSLRVMVRDYLPKVASMR
ncbi:hypothetical protein HNP60_001246 [Sphingobium sp. B1D3A]|uniref:Uncharacterized protein n=1 Tax=Sphingobium lignivorans TaxID=2735886 RepID=A0ABR6NDA9_9SPHN|nr:hypothetical protein [Sphingobium lignivorans]